MASSPLVAPPPPTTAPPQQRDPAQDYKRWMERIKGSRKQRAAMETKVWKPLYNAWVGRMMRQVEQPELENRFAQYVSVLRPHLLGNEREVAVRVTRIAAAEDPIGKMQFAEAVAGQATALLKAVGVERDAQGRQGELARCISNAMWGMGVLLFGFNPPRGMAQGKNEKGEVEDIDLDFEEAGHRELNDAGMPFCRSIDPRCFLPDLTFNDPGAGDWFGVEYYLTVAAARARFPNYAADLKRTHASVPAWEGEAETAASGEDDDGVIRLIDIYTRNPTQVITLADEGAGCKHILETRPLDLGIEGLNVLLLGFEWAEALPWPIPPLCRWYDPAMAEADFSLTVMAAARKMKVGVMVDSSKEPGLAKQLREGDANGVYELTNGNNPKEVVANLEVGGLRQEHLDVADRAGLAVERNSGMSDLMLGRRERGDQTIPEIQNRQAHISTRLANLTDPVRMFEAAAAQRIMAVAYSKLDLLNGMQLPVDSGPNAKLAVFDAQNPVIGEWLDYEFSVYVNDSVTNADEVAEAQQLLTMLPQLQPYLAQEGKGVSLAPLVDNILRKSRVQRSNEVLYDLAPPPPEPAYDPMMEQQPGGGPPAAEQPPADPGAELQELYAVLEQLPEGDPNEEPILQRIAELQMQGQAVAA